MNEAKPAAMFVFEPERVTLDELMRRWKADGAQEATKALQPELFEARRLAAYYQSMHRRAVERLAQLEAENASLKAQLEVREQQLFGRKSESSSSSSFPSPPDSAPAPAAPPAAPKRPRGQQPGKPGHKRRDHSTLPVVEEVLDLPADQRCCSACGLAFEPFPGTEDSEILEIEVKAHRRVIRRKRYRPVCSCGLHQGIVCAPPAPRVIPKSNLGVSIWVEILLDKFLSYNPTHRLLADWRSLGLDLPAGTVTGGLKKLLPLFAPIYEALIEHLRKQKHWHGDETRWLVFAKTVNNRLTHLCAG